MPNLEACFYSHGGSDVGTNLAVPGTITGRGRTIEITNAADCVPLYVINIGSADVTFRIVLNGTPLVGNTFNPDPTMWFNANWSTPQTFISGQSNVFSLPTQIPYYATEILTLNPGGNLVSWARNCFDRTRKWINVKYPDKQSVQGEF